MGITNRIYYLDVLRIIATLMVVMIHTSGMLIQETDKGTFDYWVGICNFEIVRCAVPLFFMISGALLLNPKYLTTPKNMMMKVIRVIVIMLFWSFVYSFFTCKDITLKSILFSTIKGPFHFWFFNYLIGLYLLTPLFKVIVNYKNGELVKYYLLLFTIFGIGISSLQSIDICNKWIMDVTTKVHIELMGFSGYFFLGYYLSERKTIVSTELIILILIVTYITQGIISQNATLLYDSDKWWIFTFVESICIYLIIKGLATTNVGKKIIFCSSLTMGIFILHPLFLWLIPLYMWNVKYYLLDVLFVCICSTICSFIIYKIPYIGKKLISL